LTIVKENRRQRRSSATPSATVHESVKEGERRITIVRWSAFRRLPPLVVSQWWTSANNTGALPEMLPENRRQLRRRSGQCRGVHDLGSLEPMHDCLSGGGLSAAFVDCHFLPLIGSNEITT